MNTHPLAAHIYEKGPQTLTDAISEVEKLQAAQQLTATLLPCSTVNVMTNEGGQCFQCQELGHIVCNCPNVHCFECNEYGHIAADCLDKIPPSGTPACLKRWHKGIILDQPLDITTGIGTGIAGQDCIHTLMDTEVTVVIVHAEVIPNHITDALTETLPSTVTPAPIITTVTHHTGNLQHIEVYQPTPEIVAGPECACNTRLVRTLHLNLHLDLVRQQ